MVRSAVLAAASGVVAAALLLSPAPSRASPPDEQRPPNVVVIVADDMGYADLSIHGSRDFPTPRIDSIAQAGVRFTNGYAASPSCGPSRAGLLTGRYPQRFGVEFNVPTSKGIPRGEVLLPQMLRKLGYRTMGVGKWHLGSPARFRPMRRGFDDFFGILGGSRSYWPNGQPDTTIYRNDRSIAPDFDYLTDELGRQAAAYIDEHRDRPFFLYLAFTAVHGPLEARPDLLERVKGLEPPERRTLAAMTISLDRAVGMVLDKLSEHDLAARTLVFFVNDNGGARENGSNLPLRGYKFTSFEGGIRVPFLFQWPGVVPAGEVYEEPVSLLDIFPTALAAAGGRPHARGRPVDGIDLVPFVTGSRTGPPHERLFWRHGEANWAVREGSWKLLHFRGETWLFDLSSDVSESTDRSAEQAAIVSRLLERHQTWASEMAPPLWKFPYGMRAGGLRSVPQVEPTPRTEPAPGS